MVERARPGTAARLAGIALAASVVAACTGGDDDAEVTDGTATLETISPHRAPAPDDDRSAAPDDASTTTSLAPAPADPKPGDVTVRLDVAPQFLGFAGVRELTGGLGQDVVVVTNADDDGPGSYRDALSSGERIVRFDPDLEGETIHLKSPVEATGSDLTLDGSGVDVTVQGHTTRFSGTNVVVAGMTFRYNDDEGELGDAVTFRDASTTQVAGIFGNHFEQASDGLVDVIWNHGHDVYLTMCGNSFSHHDKAVLIDSGDDDKEGGTYYVTMCRNTWTDVYQRAPHSRRARVHQFNSLFENYGKPDGAGGGSRAGGDGEDASQHLLENNIAIPRIAGEKTFDGTVVTDPRAEWASPHFGSDGAVQAVGTLLESADGVRATEVSGGEVFAPPYEYPLVEATPELAAVLRSTAGICRPVGAERVSPCAPLVLVTDPSADLGVVIEGDGVDDLVESVTVEAGRTAVSARRDGDGRWSVPVESLGDGPAEVRAEVRLVDGTVVTSDVAIVASVS